MRQQPIQWRRGPARHTRFPTHFIPTLSNGGSRGIFSSSSPTLESTPVSGSGVSHALVLHTPHPRRAPRRDRSTGRRTACDRMTFVVRGKELDRRARCHGLPWRGWDPPRGVDRPGGRHRRDGEPPAPRAPGVNAALSSGDGDGDGGRVLEAICHAGGATSPPRAPSSPSSGGSDRGRTQSPGVKPLAIVADRGSRMGNTERQRLATDTGLTIQVSSLPAGHKPGE